MRPSFTSSSRLRVPVALLTVLAVAATACGGSSTSAAGSGETEARSIDGITAEHATALATHAPLEGVAQLTASASGSCGDPWVTRAVTEVNGITPVGHVCNTRLYGNGSWSSYPDLVAKVRQRMGMCGDRWVTQAVIEATGQVPTSHQ